MVQFLTFSNLGVIFDNITGLFSVLAFLSRFFFFAHVNGKEDKRKQGRH